MTAARSALLLACLFACKETPPADSADTGPTVPEEDVAACALRGQVGREMTAGETPDTTAPALPAPGTEPATITIVEDRANYVRVEVPEPGTLVLFASETGVLLTVNDGLDVLEAEAPVPVEGCPDDVPERHEVAIAEAGTYTVRLAWAGYRQLWVYTDLLAGG